MVREKCQTSMKSSSRQRRRVWLRRSSLITLGFQFCLILLGTTLRFFGYKHKKVKFVEVAVMLLKWAAILSAFVAASLGSVLPGKRSDFSMYDNQFSKWVSVFYFGVWQHDSTRWSLKIQCCVTLTQNNILQSNSDNRVYRAVNEKCHNSIRWGKFRYASSNRRTTLPMMW